jgi:hypothetical protein
MKEFLVFVFFAGFCKFYDFVWRWSCVSSDFLNDKTFIDDANCYGVLVFYLKKWSKCLSLSCLLFLYLLFWRCPLMHRNLDHQRCRLLSSQCTSELSPPRVRLVCCNSTRLHSKSFRWVSIKCYLNLCISVSSICLLPETSLINPTLLQDRLLLFFKNKHRLRETSSRIQKLIFSLSLMIPGVRLRQCVISQTQ